MKSHAWNRLTGIAIGCVLLGFPFPMGIHAEEPATVPSTTTQTTALNDAIEKLGDPDFSEREEASRKLWLAGKTAEPLLQQAARSDDPETAGRAQTILNKFAFGLYPDTPQEIVDALQQYRAGDPQGKLGALQALSTRGPRASRVLLGLRREEKDPQLSQAILKALSLHAHDAAALLIADGDIAAAQEILLAAGDDGGSAVRDYAALLLLHGGLDARLAELRAAVARPGATSSSATLLTFLARANGDLATARSAAERSLQIATATSGDTAESNAVLEGILIEQRDWPALQQRAQKRVDQPPTDTNTLDDLAYLTAYARLSGDNATLEKAVNALQDYADKHNAENGSVARALFLNDRVDSGIALLLKYHNFMAAGEILPPRLQYQDALNLPSLALAAGESPSAVMNLRVQGAQTLRLTGDVAGAQKLLHDVATGNVSRGNFDMWIALVAVSRGLNDQASIDTFFSRALRVASPRDGLAALFAQAGIREPALMARWWLQLRNEDPRESIDESIRRFLPLAHGALLGNQLDAIADATEQRASIADAHARDRALELLVETFTKAGRADRAANVLNSWARKSSSPDVMLKLGDMQADRLQFTEAAQSYAHAWEMDHSQPVGLYLQGWALTKAGDAGRAAPLMRAADLIALGSDEARFDLFEAMTRHGSAADAEHERDLILRLSGFLSWARCEVLRLSGDAANGRDDYAAAAQFWEQAFFPYLGASQSRPAQWVDVVIPALLHRTRALSLIEKGEVPAAMVEARLLLAASPGDVDAVIDITNALQSDHHQAEADAFYTQATAPYEKLLAAFPNSGPINNLIAWGEAKTSRKLDEAVVRARRAVELEPNSTASIDTLAEVNFVRGDIPAAIEAIRRCIDLEPDVAHHRQQLARFQAAQTRPTTLPQ